MKFPKKVIIGKKVKINAFDESGIDRVEIYVDNEPRAVPKEENKWIWKDIGFHSLEAIAYDIYGLNATDSINAFIIGV